MKRFLCICLTLLCCSACLVSCGGTVDASGVTRIGFSDAVSFETIKKLDGQTVSIIGYMATLSPLDGKFMYLMNMPYQSCPFCMANSTQLANTMAVYAKNGKPFTFTDQAIRVTGKMDVGDYEDAYGYTYNYRLVDATYEKVDMSDLTDEIRLWYSLAEDGIVADVNAMFDQLYFVCNWTEYSVKDPDTGKIAYYVFPDDVYQYESEGALYENAAKPSYYDGLVTRVRAVSPDKLEDLTALIEEAKTLAVRAQAELTSKHYHTVTASDSPDGLKYELDDGKALVDSFNSLYHRFSLWLAKWEI